jgi:hypothetical protein
MGRYRFTPTDALEAKLHRGERWLLVTVGLLIAGLGGLVAGLPWRLAAFVLACGWVSATVAGGYLVPAFRATSGLHRARKREDGDDVG